MDERTYRVSVRERGSYTLTDGAGEYEAVLSGRFLYDTVTASEYPTVGDYVKAQRSGDGPCVITELLERRSVFLRRSAGTGRSEQAVAANVDTVLICMSLNRDFNLRRLERYLSLVWEGGTSPVVLLTKKDLCPDYESYVRRCETVAMSAPVLCCSSLENDGIAALEPWLRPGQTVALMGSSGVGKSTLINRLMGAELLRTDGLRNDDKGHHTTTHRELLQLPCGAAIIDTPGMRELGMWDSEEGIRTTFADMEELALRCRFSDCSHQREKGCAVLAALASGELSEERYLSWQKLKAENAYSADSESYLQAKEKKFKDIAKRNKAEKKRRS